MQERKISGYRICYPDCKQETHQGQKLNFVCLQERCKDCALVCSLCRYDKHLGHSTKPLKFYLEQVEAKYSTQLIKTDEDLLELENMKIKFFISLKQSVQRIAQEFQLLERNVIQRFQQLKSEILEQESRKNQFQQFYQSLTTTGKGNPEELIRNYMPKNSISRIQGSEELTQFTKLICQKLTNIRKNLIKEVPRQTAPPLISINKSIHQLFEHSATIQIQNGVFCHKATSGDDAMMILKQKIKDVNGNIRINIIQMKPGARITIGAMRTQIANSLNFKWNQSQVSADCQWVTTDNKLFNGNFNYLGNVIQGASLEIKIKKNHIKINNKKNTADFIFGNFDVVFFSLKGDIKVQIKYPYIK